MAAQRPRRASVSHLADHPDNLDREFLKARRAQADATAALAAAIVGATTRFGPVADTVHSFGMRLDALCLFLKKKGPWMLASVPMVLVLVNAVSPQAAAGLAESIAKITAALAH